MHKIGIQWTIITTCRARTERLQALLGETKWTNELAFKHLWNCMKRHLTRVPSSKGFAWLSSKSSSSSSSSSVQCAFTVYTPPERQNIPTHHAVTLLEVHELRPPFKVCAHIYSAWKWKKKSPKLIGAFFLIQFRIYIWPNKLGANPDWSSACCSWSP